MKVYIVVEYSKDNFEYCDVVDVFANLNDARECVRRCREPDYYSYREYIIVDKVIKGEV